MDFKFKITEVDGEVHWSENTWLGDEPEDALLYEAKKAKDDGFMYLVWDSDAYILPWHRIAKIEEV